MASIPPKTLAPTARAKTEDKNRNRKPPANALSKMLVRYEVALKLLHKGKYAEAHRSFQELLPNVPAELRDRVQVYLAVCSKKCLLPDNIESHDRNDRFDYAVLLLNAGRYQEARTHLESIQRSEGKTAQIAYGFALLAGMIGDNAACIGHLAEAISLEEQYRIRALYESSFEDLANDQGFEGLVSPKSS